MMADSESTTGRAPAFQFYPKDFLHDSNVVLMNLTERGAYITLLCYCWSEGSILNDPSKLAKFCHVSPSVMRRLWVAIAPCFRPAEEPGRLIHPRLERERQKQLEFKRRQSENGRKGGRPHKPNETQNNPTLSSGLTQTEPKESSSSLSSSSFASSDFSQERARPRPVMGGGAGVGSNPRDHLYCRGNGSRCSRICVSEKQHSILRAKFGGDERTSDEALDAFYAEVRSRLDPNQPIGDTPWKFWEAQFAAKFGTVAGAQNPRTAGNAAAAARFVARGQR
jgi:uncharacterized protein YdaU (DUF1376 family)